MCPSKMSFLEGINDGKPAENSRKVALQRASTLKKNCLRRWHPAAVRGSRIYSWSTHFL